ncbi:MAG TPA: chemotaxis-specific protein-glutamate methyltransferase CheB [Gemmatimonadaceae bacterium]|nr:chemotaxis-specific protein-glutamate methyltransferase CheB [Gemmatimonadaceae bacterium]
MSSELRVLVVDDSALLGAVVAGLIEDFGGYRVVGTARDGEEALRLVHALDPDIVTLDIEMPGVDGLHALGYIMSECPRPVVMVSGATRRGDVDLTIRAFELGAVEFVRKPDERSHDGWLGVAPRLREALKAAAQANTDLPLLVRPRVPGVKAARRLHAATEVVAVASSTGGPRALAELVSGLDAAMEAAVVIVQHMPAGFTAGLARRLETQSGEPLLAGTVYVAPGGRHLVLERDGDTARLQCVDTAAEHGVRPAADPLFRAAANAFGPRALGVVLTGMGRDGSDGLRAILRAGGRGLVQDRGTSAVYGMPQQARGVLAADREFPLGAMAAAIAREASAMRGEK